MRYLPSDLMRGALLTVCRDWVHDRFEDDGYGMSSMDIVLMQRDIDCLKLVHQDHPTMIMTVVMDVMGAIVVPECKWLRELRRTTQPELVFLALAPRFEWKTCITT